MVTSNEFYKFLKAKGINFFTGVPDSTFKEVFRLLEQDVATTYIPAVSEDVAIGLAVGGRLGGQFPMVLMQNSGLGVSINALASLATLYKVPILLMIGWRGYQGKDAPEHLIMGESMLNLLQDIGVPYEVLEAESVYDDTERAIAQMETHSIPVALIIRKGILA